MRRVTPPATQLVGRVAGVEIGVYDFGELYPDPRTGHQVDPRQRLRDLIEEADLADQVGLDVFGLGEHHRADFVVSAPAVALAAMAERTHRIRLTSAVSVLSSDDPVRVFQQFATLDLISRGRAEIMAGRGSFTESFPLFGFALDDYDELFAEKIELLLRIRDSDPVTWSGRHRPAMRAQGVYPRPDQEKLPVWIAVGGNPQSAVRAGVLGVPMAIAIIGGQPERFVALAEIYREAGRRAGHEESTLRVSINSHTFVANTSDQAGHIFFPHYAVMMGAIGRERGWGGVLTRESFEASRQPDGALLVGSAEEVAEKIIRQHAIFGHQRFLAQLSVGTVPHHHVMRAIELLGTEVAPLVRQELEG
jgi:probable LLM family oxidoreductase